MKRTVKARQKSYITGYMLFSADFSVNKSSVSSFCVAVGLRAIHLLLRVKIKMAEMESC